MLAGKQYEGWFCRDCEREIDRADEIEVDVDAEWDGDRWHDLSRVWHVECPAEHEDC